ncbi:MAG TPA: VWA domain-containing protein [Thermoanaerobaculia bacterium]|nr:VWA domain-containing protein [Thermoanaerobaculia bacterium]
MQTSWRPVGRVRFFLSAGAFLLLAAGLVRAQAKPPAPAAAPAPTPAGTFISRETVAVTNVDVVVEDGKGNRVTGLRREDFIIIEDGLEQPITNFFAVQQGRLTVLGDEELPPPPPVPPAGVPPPAAAGAPPTPKTRIVIFVDNLSLTPFNRNRVLRNVEEWVRTAVKDNVEGMIVVWNRSLKIRRSFTNDGRDLSDVLKQIEDESAQGTTRNSSFKDVLQQIDDAKSIDQATVIARRWAEEQQNDLRYTFDAIKSTITKLSGVDGRKILVHVSEGLPQSPGAEVWRYVQDKFKDSSTMMNQFQYDQTPSYISIIQAANAAGVTLYMFDATGLAADPNVSAENRYQSARLDTFVQRSNNQSMLQLLAEETGGQAVINRNDVTLDLGKIEKDFTSYYSLGYRSLRSGLDRPHKLEVKVKRKGLVARSRRSFVEKGIETRTVEAVMSGLAFSRDENPLAAGLEVGQALPSDSGYFQVPVRIRIPYSRIAMLPEGPKVRGRLTFYFVVMDSLEKTSDLSSQTKVLEMDAKRFDELQKKDFIYDVSLLMIPGRQRLSFAVRDETTTTTSYLQQNIFVSVFSGEAPRK